MQVPEKLSLIGGSILLSSTLIFTLKSQASNILPKVERPISSIYDHAGDAQRGSSFPSDFNDARRNGEQTGTWGTAQYYVNDNNIYVGSGKLDGELTDILGNDRAQHIQAIHFKGDVVFPVDSYRLLWSLGSLQRIDGTEHIDTSQVTIMEGMFEDDFQLSSVDMSHMDTSHVVDMNATIYPIWISQISLGPKTKLISGLKMPDTNWKDGNHIINTQQMMDGHPHPGTWTATWNK